MDNQSFESSSIKYQKLDQNNMPKIFERKKGRNK